jgi:rhamnosyltransferase
MHFPLASVVIRNRNEHRPLGVLLQALQRQTVLPEVIVVDNESTDGSQELVKANGARLVHLAKSDFTYGHAINVGVANASAEIIVMLSSHSLPLGDRFIEACLEPFADERVGAVRCLRMDRAQEWLTASVLEGPIDWNFRLSILPENNGCAFRKSVWREIPFDEQIEACEDRLWCYHVLNAGHRIATAGAWYQYSLTESFWPSLRKYRREQTAFYRMTGHRPPLRDLLRDALVTAPRQAAKTAVRTALYGMLRAAITAMAPWYACRPPRAGSVR